MTEDEAKSFALKLERLAAPRAIIHSVKVVRRGEEGFGFQLGSESHMRGSGQDVRNFAEAAYKEHFGRDALPEEFSTEILSGAEIAKREGRPHYYSR